MLVTFVGSLVPEVIAYNAGLDACAGRWLEAMDLAGGVAARIPETRGTRGTHVETEDNNSYNGNIMGI